MTDEPHADESEYPFLKTYFFSFSRGQTAIELFPASSRHGLARSLAPRGWSCLEVSSCPTGHDRLAAIRKTASGLDAFEGDRAAISGFIWDFVDEVIVVDALIIGPGEGDPATIFGDETPTGLRPRVLAVARTRDDFEEIVQAARQSRYTDRIEFGNWRVLCRGEDVRTLSPLLQEVGESESGWADRYVAVLRTALAEKDAELTRLCVAFGSSEAQQSKGEADLDVFRQAMSQIRKAATAEIAAMGKEIGAAALRLAEAGLEASPIPMLEATPEAARLGARRQLLDRDRRLPSATVFRQRRVSRALAERRRLVLESGLFEPDWYLEWHGDVAASSKDPLWHFVEYGSLERRDPGPGFNSEAYLAAYPDVARAAVEPFFHYLVYGRKERRFNWRTAPWHSGALFSV